MVDTMTHLFVSLYSSLRQSWIVITSCCSLCYQELYKNYTQHEKKYGDKGGIENVIVSKRKFQYEEVILYCNKGWKNHMIFIYSAAESQFVQFASQWSWFQTLFCCNGDSRILFESAVNIQNGYHQGCSKDPAFWRGGGDTYDKKVKKILKKDKNKQTNSYLITQYR